MQPFGHLPQVAKFVRRLQYRRDGSTQGVVVAGARDRAEKVKPAPRGVPDAVDLLPGAFSGHESTDRGSMAGYPSRWRPSLSRAGVLLRSWAAEEAEYGHLFYWVPVFMGMGAVFWFSASRTPSAIQVGLLLLLFLAGALLLRYRRPLFGMVCGALAMLCLGALSAAWESESAATVILDSPVTTTLTAVVTEREAVAGGRWRYGLDVIATEKPRLKRAPLRVTLTASAGKTPLGLGDRVRGRARLLTPSGPALAGLNDFGFDAYFSGSGAIGFFYGSPDKVEMNIAPSSSVYRSFRLFIEGLRGGISARIRSVLPGDTGAFAASMITDDRRAIGKETTEALRLAGLTHIVAISGLNMALAAGIFFVGIRALLSLSQTIAHRYPVKKIAAAGALVTVTGYYLISGFAVSAERAYIMMAIMLVAAMMGRPSISLRNVALSALVILALSPSAVMGPGFQMSFAATLALVTGYSVWQRRTDNRPNPAMPGFLKPIAAIWTFAFGIFATSLIGGLSTALFSIGHFHRIAVWGLPANLLAMPIISLVVMPAGLAALILMPVGLDWLPLKAMGIGLDLVIAIAKWAASLGGDVVTGRIAGWLFVGLSACLLVLAIMRSPLRLAGLAAGILLLLSNAFMPAAPRPDIVVHEDGRLAGLVTGDAIASTASRPAAFVFEQWLRALPARNHLKPVLKEALPRSHDRKPFDEAEKRAETALLDADLDSMPAGRFLCRVGRWCAARAWNGSRIIVMERRELVGRACDRADLVVTPARLRWRACRSGAMLLSAETLRRSGTMEIWLDPENIRQFRVISVLGDIDRPWYAHRTYDWRSGEFVGKGSQSTE